ncbi:membrane protein [Kiloniella litopenaei]|uniref:Membrane protein n=1 Tax=Kiloniella litopenaei TaxID=1549748 RepID=A0A0M2R382_9PROT|nr:Bax inhibitor-1/YccA family protein [Kiloniella litopenaei]KKJ76121.1 membrane protein [Kiloniella litopenaei]
MIDRSTQRSVGYGQATAADIDAGLRKYMLGVYNYMSIALVITGLAAFGVSQSPELMYAIFGSPLKWVVMLAPLGMVFFLSARINSLQASTAQILFWVFSVLMGVSISSIFIAYEMGSIARVFFITAASFAGLSLVGYTTKKNLSAMGSFLIIGLFGLIIASIVNIFIGSSGLEFVISVLGVLIFAGLTAYDTQRIKLMYMESDHSEVAQKKSIMGALSLYLNFLNMFLFLLQLFGNRE